jgi:ABC-type branched-subunit amino acid transport system substrate-binding protein
MFTQQPDNEFMSLVFGSDVGKQLVKVFNSFIQSFDLLSDDYRKPSVDFDAMITKAAALKNAVLSYMNSITGALESLIIEQLEALETLLRSIKDKSLKTDTLKQLPLLKGHAGVGINAIIFYKG